MQNKIYAPITGGTMTNKRFKYLGELMKNWNDVEMKQSLVDEIYKDNRRLRNGIKRADRYYMKCNDVGGYIAFHENVMKLIEK